MKQLKIKRMIILVSILIVLIIILMIGITLFQKEEERQEEMEILNKGNFIPTSYEKQIVTDHSTFFSVAQCVQKYLDGLSLNVNEISSTPVSGTNMRSATTIYAENQDITDEESKKEAIYNFLSASYIEQKHITKDNVLDKIEDKEQVELIPLKMYELLGNNKSQYALYGKVKSTDNEQEVEEVYYIINVDKTNNAFNITPVERNKYNDVNDIPLGEKDEAIEQNKNNIFSYHIMQENEIAQKYFTYYKKLMLEDSETAYNLLDEQYRNKRFGSLEEFKTYVDKNKEEIEGYLAKQYEANEITGATEYICKDQYQHYYTYHVTAAMQFTVKLDNYTIESEEVQQKYNGGNETRKVQMNVDKWILMLNNKDYKAAYEVLDESFREQYFGTVEKFEEYMRGRFPEYYGLTFSDFSEEAGVYIQKILLTDIRAKQDFVLPETIIMKLTDDGFRMSFRILS